MHFHSHPAIPLGESTLKTISINMITISYSVIWKQNTSNDTSTQRTGWINYQNPTRWSVDAEGLFKIKKGLSKPLWTDVEWLLEYFSRQSEWTPPPASLFQYSCALRLTASSSGTLQGHLLLPPPTASPCPWAPQGAGRDSGKRYRSREALPTQSSSLLDRLFTNVILPKNTDIPNSISGSTTFCVTTSYYNLSTQLAWEQDMD